MLDIISFLIVLRIIRDGQIEFLIYNEKKINGIYPHCEQDYGYFLTTRFIREGFPWQIYVVHFCDTVLSS